MQHPLAPTEPARAYVAAPRVVEWKMINLVARGLKSYNFKVIELFDAYVRAVFHLEYS